MAFFTLVYCLEFFTQNFRSERVILTTLRVNNQFSGFFQSCFGDVQKFYWHCFLAFEGTILGLFSVRKVNILPSKSKFLVKLCHSETFILDHFQCQKTRSLRFFKVVLKMLRSCLRIIFDLNRLTYWSIFSSKG